MADSTCHRVAENPLNISGVIMGMMASQITSLIIVYSTVCLSADQRKHQRSASLAFVWGIVTGEFPAQMASSAEMLHFDDVIMIYVANQSSRRWTSWHYDPSLYRIRRLIISNCMRSDHIVLIFSRCLGVALLSKYLQNSKTIWQLDTHILQVRIFWKSGSKTFWRLVK